MFLKLLAFLISCTLLFIVVIYIIRCKTGNPFDKIAENDSLKRFGYKLYVNGRIERSIIGSDKINGIWAYGNIHDFEPYLLTHYHQDVIYLLYRSDGVMNDDDSQKPFILFLQKWPTCYPKLTVVTCALHKDVTVSNNNVRILTLPTPFKWHPIQLPELPDYESWKKIKIHKAFWVGATNGIVKKHNSTQYQGTRLNIYHAVQNNPSIVFHFSNTSHISDLPKLNRRIDIGEQNQYRLIFCIDGWGFPGNLDWVLTQTDCVPLICTNFHMGFLDKHLIPWEHYIPIKPDGSDVNDIVNRVLKPNYTRELYNLLRRLRKVVQEKLTPENLKSEWLHSLKYLYKNSFS